MNTRPSKIVCVGRSYADHVKELNNAMMWNSDTYYRLNGAKLHITNIRMFEKPIELEQHHNVLNQYVVRDNQLALIIDNAIPSIGFQKFKNAR